MFPVRKKKKPQQLPLTPLIDVFSIITVFLILGSVFAKTDIVLPKGMKLAKSRTVETMDTAPQLTIFDNRVKASFSKREYPLSAFRGDSQSTHRSRLTNEIKKYFSTLSKSTKRSGKNLNITTDRSTKYKDVFDVISVFRKEGFDTLLFVAEGEGEKRDKE